jgi:hypothetical protein
LKLTEAGCRLGSGGGGTQHQVPDETKKVKEMRFNLSLLSNTLCLIMNFSIYLLEVVIIVKNIERHHIVGEKRGVTSQKERHRGQVFFLDIYCPISYKDPAHLQ